MPKTTKKPPAKMAPHSHWTDKKRRTPTCKTCVFHAPLTEEYCAKWGKDMGVMICEAYKKRGVK